MNIRMPHGEDNRQSVVHAGVHIENEFDHVNWSGPQVSADGCFEIAVYLHASIVVKREHLHHDDRGDLSFGIHPEVSVVNAGPAVTAGGTQVRVVGIGSGDLKSETELVL